MKKFAVLKYLFISGMLLSSFESWADFEPRAEHRPGEPYGDIQRVPYYDAIERKTLNPREGILYNDIPEYEIWRFYGRASINGSEYSLEKVTNKSPGIGVNPMAIGTTIKTKGSQNSIGLELAIGVTYNLSWRGEFEYLVNRNFHYAASPVLAGVPAVAFASDIKNNTILLNFYYDFSGFHGFRPYVMAGFGAGANDARSVASPFPLGGNDLVKRQVCLAYNLGAGIRFKVMPSWYIDLKYRFTNLGIAKMQTSTINLSGTLTMNAISLGLIYIF